MANNASQIRGDIQDGLSGDKRAGFDPAVAPLETDSEAGGAPLSPEQTELARRGQAGGIRERPEAVGYGDAMRETRKAPSGSKAVYWTVAGVLAAVAVGSVILIGGF